MTRMFDKYLRPSNIKYVVLVLRNIDDFMNDVNLLNIAIPQAEEAFRQIDKCCTFDEIRTTFASSMHADGLKDNEVYYRVVFRWMNAKPKNIWYYILAKWIYRLGIR